MSTSSPFEEFTNLYELSKTLRFELKPVGKTKELLEENSGLFPKDKRIDEIYQNIIKPCLNELHSQLIEQSLSGVVLGGLDDTVFSSYQHDRSDKIYENRKKDLRKSVITFMKNSKFEHAKGFNDLMSKEVIDIIINVFGNNIYTQQDTKKKYEYPDLLGKSYKELIEEYFKGFFTYLTNFNTNRANLYKDDGKASRVATRVIDENLSRFFQNKIIYQSKIEKTNSLNEQQKLLFETISFNNYLNQKGIETYNKQIGEINSLINQYNQNNHLTGNNKIPKLQSLHRQILAQGERGSMSNFIDSLVESYYELQQVIENFVEITDNKTNMIKNNLFDKILDYDIFEIYIKKSNLKILSNKYFTNYTILESLLPKIDETGNGIKDTEDETISLDAVNQALKSLDQEKENQEIFKAQYIQPGMSYFQMFIYALQKDVHESINLIKQNVSNLQKYVMEGDFEKNILDAQKNIVINEVEMNRKNILKEYMDSVLTFDKIVNIFSLTKGQGENKIEIEIDTKDSDFYVLLDEYKQGYTPFKIYNAVRNFLTKKSFNTEKIKLNFENSTFLDGWDRNKESDNFGVLLRKEGKYYLAIMKKGHNKFFDNIKNKQLYETSTSLFEKVNYKLLPGPDKMLPKVFFSKKNIGYFAPTEQILHIRNISSHTKNGSPQDGFEKSEFNIHDCWTMIDFYKQCLARHEERKEFQFIFKATQAYRDLSEFYYDVAIQGYKINFQKIDEKTLIDAVDQGNIYLFQIYNKDFAEYKKGNENLHTMYWKAIFEPENFVNGTVFKLNGQAEVFFRPQSINKTNKHIENWKQKHQGLDIIENKRYTENKILFHCPITLNFVNQRDLKVNDKVKEYCKQNEMSIIGIDRGEKHLLYYSLINQEGVIQDIASLNTLVSKLPDGSTKEIPYAEKLINKEGNRNKERKNRDEIETIKELKEGYISQVVNILVEMAIQHNAIIVMEDLNSGFKRGRQKVERQIYQKFELALTKKLNYVVSKNKEKQSLGGLYKAYQLTPKIDNFQDIYTQTGIVFYTQAGYTSTTCPICGFRKNVYRKYKSVGDTKNLIKNMTISYTNGSYIFEYSIPASEDKRGNILQKLQWTLNTKNQIRLYATKNTGGPGWVVQKFDLTQKFNELFKEIDKNNIVQGLIALPDSHAQPFKDFMFYWNLLLQIRNSEEKDDGGYLQCPACGFHSDSGFQGHHYNGDANGAYNIARKGLILLEKIRKNAEKLGITNVEWDNFSQK